MEILKKNYVRILAVMLAVVISVGTPISDFADTQGIHETEAAGVTTLITVAKLFGAIAGAYGIYVAADNLADWADEWVTWTSTRNSEAYNDLQAIKQGVVSYILKRTLIKSVADFLKTKTAPSAYYAVKGLPYGVHESDMTLPDNAYTDSFYQNVIYGSMSTSEPVMIRWDYDETYSSGIYTYYFHYPTNSWWKQNFYENDNASFVAYHIPTENTGWTDPYREYMCVSVFDDAGLPIAFKRFDSQYSYEMQSVQYYYDGSLGWRQVKSPKGLSEVFEVAEFETGYFYFYYPIGVTSLEKADTGASIDKIEANTIRVKSLNVDYTVHGNNALDNTDALTGAEVTEDNLVNLHDVSAEAYESWLKSQQNNEDNNDESDPNLNLALNTALASAIASAVVKELKDMGYIETPSDTPSEGVDDAILGDIQISVDGVTEAVRQLGSKLQNIAEGIANFPTQIRDAIKSVFEELFIPDTEALETILSDFGDKFPWVDTLFSYFTPIRDAINQNSSSPPVIYIHFENSENPRYKALGTMKVFDGSWYAPYKPMGDSIISAFLWLFFIWRLIKNIPNIISGGGMIVESHAEFDYAQAKNFGSAKDATFRKG